MKYYKYIFQGIKITLAKLVSVFMKINIKYRDVWLVGERKNEAKDNGYHFFKYVRENHSDKNIYYVITESSSEINKIKEYGNIIFYDSFKHYVYYFLSTKLISAHAGSNMPDSPIIWWLKGKGIFNRKVIYLKHGIIKETIPSHRYENTKYDMIICGAKPEYDFVKEELGYPKENVKYLGLCRFDNLHDFKTKNQIFMMLTWRKWFDLGDSIEDKVFDEKRFLRSKYFKEIKMFLESKEIDKALIKNNIELIFHPHHEIQRFIKHFKSVSKNIIIAKEGEYDVQELLKSSKILITDYSSVAFDFAYMKKPIIYYQFDSEEYYKSHYQKGYFDYEKDGFGDVASSVFEVVNCLKNTIDNGAFNQNKYNTRIDEFFTLNDKENCRRTYEEIKRN